MRSVFVTSGTNGEAEMYIELKSQGDSLSV